MGATVLWEWCTSTHELTGTPFDPLDTFYERQCSLVGLEELKTHPRAKAAEFEQTPSFVILPAASKI